MTPDRATLLRYLEGDLPAAEADALRRHLADDADLRTRLARLEALAGTLAAAPPPAFAPGFEARVLRRLQAEETPAEALYRALRALFGRTALATASLAALLAAYNVTTFRDLGAADTWLEALLGLPSTTLVDALSYGLM